MKSEVSVFVQVGWWTCRLVRREPGEARSVMSLQYCDIGGSCVAGVRMGGRFCWGGAGGGCGGGIARARATGGEGYDLSWTPTRSFGVGVLGDVVGRLELPSIPIQLVVNVCHSEVIVVGIRLEDLARVYVSLFVRGVPDVWRASHF